MWLNDNNNKQMQNNITWWTSILRLLEKLFLPLKDCLLLSNTQKKLSNLTGPSFPIPLQLVEEVRPLWPNCLSSLMSNVYFSIAPLLFPLECKLCFLADILNCSLSPIFRRKGIYVVSWSKAGPWTSGMSTNRLSSPISPSGPLFSPLVKTWTLDCWEVGWVLIACPVPDASSFNCPLSYWPMAILTPPPPPLSQAQLVSHRNNQADLVE